MFHALTSSMETTLIGIGNNMNASLSKVSEVVTNLSN